MAAAAEAVAAAAIVGFSITSSAVDPYRSDAYSTAAMVVAVPAALREVMENKHGGTPRPRVYNTAMFPVSAGALLKTGFRGYSPVH